MSRPPHADGHRPDAGVRRAKRYPGLGWSSIERQLPLLIWGLLLPTVAILIGWTYVEVRRDLLESATTRLEGHAHELAALFDRKVSVRLRFAERAAARTDVVTWLRDPLDERRAELEEAMRGYLDRWSPGVMELWTADGRCVLEVEAPPEDPIPVRARRLYLQQGPPPREPGQQPLRIVANDVVLHEVVAEVRDPSAEARGSGTDDLLGYCVLRWVVSGRQGQAILGGFVDNVRFMLGNEADNVWTDLEKRVSGPPVDPLDKSQRIFRVDGVQRIGAGIRIDDSPWVVWVENDATRTLARARRLFLHMAAVGAVLLLLGGIGARWISRRVASPLRELNEAAASIAGGDYDLRLEPQRPDEVGRLAQAFNVMAEKVGEAHTLLEERVARRTEDLQKALQRLRDTREELLRQERLALLGEIAGGIGHELRDPLNVISSTIACLELGLEDARPEVHHQLGILRRQVGLSEKIIQGLLAYTRDQPPESRSLSLARVVDQQVERLGPLRVELVCDVPDDLRAFGDPVQIGQILFNLLVNAVQATEGRPDPQVRVRGYTCDDEAFLEVSDNGGGVPAELRDRIFAPLFTTRASGIGLGLAVSRRMARANGGDLVLTSAAGSRGATFVLALPVVAALPKR